MNPLILLFGLLGTGAAARFGFGKGKPDKAGIGRDDPEIAFDPEGQDTSDPTGKDAPLTPTVDEYDETPAPTASQDDEETPDPAPSAPQDEEETPAPAPTASQDDEEAPAPAPTTSQNDDAETPAPAPAPTTSQDDGGTQSPDPTAPTAPTSPTSTPTSPTSPTAPAPTDPTNTPTAPTQPGGGSGDGASTTPISSQGTVDVVEGRVATIQPAASDIAGLRIVSDVQHGHVTVNPDNTFALVMTQSNFTGSQSFVYEATHSDGSVTQHQVDLNVSPGSSSTGWATGESHYMLATDANDNVIVEYGDNHRAVYISGSQNALSLNDIAALEGISASQIDGSWLANSDYGKTQATALDLNAGMQLWNTISPYRAQDSSNWLMFERGYTYDNYGDLLNPGVNGESEMNPILIGAWGQGAHPVMQEELFVFAESSKNVVVQGLHFTEGVTFLDASNVILDDLILTDDSLVIQNGSGFSLRNSAFYDIKNTHSEGNIQNGKWMVDGNRVAGTYIDTIDGLLLEGNFFDQNGWSPDYALDASATGGQPPIMFNHNIYLQRDNLDVTVRDTITMRAASIGMQVRSGGFIEDNVYIDNNVAGNFGTYSDAAYSLFTDNLVTDAGGKAYHPDSGGAVSAGIDTASTYSTLIDNIITHISDPNAGSSTIPWTDWSIAVPSSYYDDTIVYNWDMGDNGSYGAYITEQNTAGLDTSVLDQTTIQIFAEQLLGAGNGSIDALADYLRGQATGLYADTVDADVIIDFFQQGFGIASAFRTAPTTLRFVPDDLGEGIRWDNRLNWDTDDLPGLYSQDSADLGGNHVVFGDNASIDTLDLSGGALKVYGGRLDASGGIQGEGGAVNVEGPGQIWLGGSDGSALDAAVTGGRFANTGNMSGADLTVSGGQAILATGGAEYDVNAGDDLAILGGSSKVGFDSDDGGLAVLDFQSGSSVTFTAADGDLGEITEFRSGAFGTSPDVASGIDLGGTTLNVDLSGLSASAGTAFTLMSSDELVGLFGNAVVGGLGARDANIVIDYQNDTVTLQLTSGSGAVNVSTVGAESDVSAGEDAIWTALTAGQGVVTNSQPAMLPGDDPTADPLNDPLGIAA